MSTSLLPEGKGGGGGDWEPDEGVKVAGSSQPGPSGGPCAVVVRWSSCRRPSGYLLRPTSCRHAGDGRWSSCSWLGSCTDEGGGREEEGLREAGR
jgi:hypothetical protein